MRHVAIDPPAVPALSWLLYPLILAEPHRHRTDLSTTVAAWMVMPCAA